MITDEPTACFRGGPADHPGLAKVQGLFTPCSSQRDPAVRCVNLRIAFAASPDDIGVLSALATALRLMGHEEAGASLPRCRAATPCRPDTARRAGRQPHAGRAIASCPPAWVPRAQGGRPASEAVHGTIWQLPAIRLTRGRNRPYSACVQTRWNAPQLPPIAVSADGTGNRGQDGPVTARQVHNGNTSAYFSSHPPRVFSSWAGPGSPISGCPLTGRQAAMR